MPPPTSPTVRRRRLAAELRRLREVRELTLDDVADRLQWSASKLSRLENAKSGAKPIDVRRLLDLYGVTVAHTDELLALAREAEKKGWWEAYSETFGQEVSAFIGLEAEAETEYSWETKIIPGLLQTHGYARQSVLAMQPIVGLPPGQVEALVRARVHRQEIITRERPLRLSVVLDESVLRRDFGGRQVMYEQLQRLLELAHLANLTLQVRRLDSTEPPPGVDSFSLLHFGPTYHDVAYAEVLMRGVYFEEDLDTYHFGLTFDRLAKQSLSPDDSVKLISEIAEGVWR